MKKTFKNENKVIAFTVAAGILTIAIAAGMGLACPALAVLPAIIASAMQTEKKNDEE